MDFKYRPPYKWTQVSADTGICITETVNCEFILPPPEPECFGSLILSVSEITPAEKALRDSLRNADPNKQDDNVRVDFSGKHTSYKYELGTGHYGTEAGELYIDNRTGAKTTKPATKKQKKFVYQVSKINYASWAYFPINDSLEILIAFRGTIPDNQMQSMDGAVEKFADYFFVQNDTLIDSLLALTNPFRFDPVLLPVDSVMFLNTYFKYPILPGWTYDTTRTFTDIKTNFLSLKANDNTDCDNATININYRVTPYEQKAKREEVVQIPLVVLMEVLKNPPPKEKPLSDSARAHIRDSAFQNMEQHYFYSFNSNQEPTTKCNGREMTTVLLSVYIYTKQDERIRITILFSYMTGDYKTERKYRYDFYRFITQLTDKTDFEQFYLNNKKD